MNPKELFQLILNRFYKFKKENPLEFIDIVLSYHFPDSELFRHVKRMVTLDITLNNPVFNCIIIENPNDVIFKLYKKTWQEDYFCYEYRRGNNIVFTHSVNSTTFEDAKVNEQICKLFGFILVNNYHNTIGQFAYALSTTDTLLPQPRSQWGLDKNFTLGELRDLDPLAYNELIDRIMSLKGGAYLSDEYLKNT